MFMRQRVVIFNDSWKILIKAVDEWKTEFLSDYCTKVCNSECCRTIEHSGLSEAQIRCIFSLSKKDALYKKKNRYGQSIIQKEKDGTFFTELCFKNPCPSLNEKGLCRIYNDELKPYYCDNYPFYYNEVDGVNTLEIEKCVGIKNLDLSKIYDAAKKANIKVDFIKRLSDY